MKIRLNLDRAFIFCFEPLWKILDLIANVYKRYDKASNKYIKKKKKKKKKGAGCDVTRYESN